MRLITSCDMTIYKLPKTTEFWHPVGIVIGGKSRIGEHCIIGQNVTIGQVVVRDVSAGHTYVSKHEIQIQPRSDQ